MLCLTAHLAYLVHKSGRKTSINIYAVLADPGSNNSGYYELQAVLTHKGRSSSSGHYVGWCRNKGGQY